MKKNILQKRMAKILIGLGTFLGLFILIFFYWNIVRIPGFPELLPSNETAAYFEFPTQLADSNPLKASLNENLKLDWDKDVAPWAASRGAIALLTQEKSDKLMPFVLLQVRSTDQALAFLRNFQNPSHIMKEKPVDGISTFSTSSLHFTFLSGILILSPSEEHLTQFLGYQKSLASFLSGDREFERVYRATSDDFLVYATPAKIPYEILDPVARALPSLPLMLPVVNHIGVGASHKDNRFIGTSFAILNSKITSATTVTAAPYTANLLPLVPAEFGILIAGRDLATQIQELEQIFPKDAVLFSRPENLVRTFAVHYTPGVNFDSVIAPLFKGEFAMTIKNGGQTLFITDVKNISSAEKNIADILAAFKTVAGEFVPTSRSVTLEDGTEAAELVPDPSEVKDFSESFSGSGIHGLQIGSSTRMGKTLGVYEAIRDGKLFVSNDLETLKKSLTLAQQPQQSLNIRESGYYKNFLQPILKNPELLGISILPQGIFSFSKQMHEDVMETNFVFGKL